MKIKILHEIKLFGINFQIGAIWDLETTMKILLLSQKDAIKTFNFLLETNHAEKIIEETFEWDITKVVNMLSICDFCKQINCGECRKKMNMIKNEEIDKFFEKILLLIKEEFIKEFNNIIK